jgi:hypothetical protein
LNSVDALEKETNFLEKLKKSLKNKPKTVEKPELPKDDKKLVKPLVKVADEDEDDEEEKIPTKAKK